MSLAQPLRLNGLGTAVLSLLLSGPSVASASQAPTGADANRSSLVLHLDRPLPSSEVGAEALVALESAIEEWNGGDRLGAAVAADEALSQLPGLADWRPLLFAELLVEAGEPEVVAAALADVSRGSDLWSRWGWRVLVDAYEEADDLPAARDAARTQARTEPDPGRACVRAASRAHARPGAGGRAPDRRRRLEGRGRRSGGSARSRPPRGTGLGEGLRPSSPLLGTR